MDQALAHVEKEPVIGKPKTYRGRRTLRLRDTPVPGALRTMRDRQAAAFGAEQARSGYVCVDEIGRPVQPAAWSAAWRAHLAATFGYDLAELPLRTARNWSVSIMRSHGVPDVDVAAHHGHSESIMREVYTSSDADRQASASAAFWGVIRPSEER